MPVDATAAALDAVPRELAAMDRALALAAAGLGDTSPNPSVGAVILDAAGQLAGEGRSAPAGGPHAEIRALTQAGPAARAVPRWSPWSPATTPAGPGRVPVR